MRVRASLLISITVLLLASCSSPHQLPESPTLIPRLAAATLPAAEAPAAPEAGGREPAGTAGGDSAGGQAIYDNNCAVCHNLNNQQKVGPGLAGLFGRPSLPNGQPFSEAALGEWIRAGGGAMPGIALSDGDLANLITHLREATQ